LPCSPLLQPRDAAHTQGLHLVHRASRTDGQDPTRWTLVGIRHACPWFHARVMPGVPPWSGAASSGAGPAPVCLDAASALTALATVSEPMRANPRRTCGRRRAAATIARYPAWAWAAAMRGAAQAHAALRQCAVTLTRVGAPRDAPTSPVGF